MIKIIFFSLFFVLVNCAQNPKQVYWCGDHACKSKKERKLYFEKTMIVEVRNKNKLYDDKKIVNKGTKTSSKILKTKKINNTVINKNKKIVSKKKLDLIKTQPKKNTVVNKKINNKKTSKNKLVKLNKKDNIKINKVKKKKPIKSNLERSYVSLEKYLDKHDDFETIVEIIVSNNKNKPYPDINNFPE